MLHNAEVKHDEVQDGPNLCTRLMIICPSHGCCSKHTNAQCQDRIRCQLNINQELSCIVT